MITAMFLIVEYILAVAFFPLEFNVTLPGKPRGPCGPGSPMGPGGPRNPVAPGPPGNPGGPLFPGGPG